ncbi:MAG: hypothetical protein ACE5OZ_02300 [Candidatus Heimdallarchaeota archaeon]
MNSRRISFILLVLFIFVYYLVVNALFFAPLPYSVKEDNFFLSDNLPVLIYDQWAREVTVEIKLAFGGPITLIYQVISDDFYEEINKTGKHQFSFHTNRISLWLDPATNATSAEGTYKVIDHTSHLACPLLDP